MTYNYNLFDSLTELYTDIQVDQLITHTIIYLVIKVLKYRNTNKPQCTLLQNAQSHYLYDLTNVRRKNNKHPVRDVLTD